MILKDISRYHHFDIINFEIFFPIFFNIKSSHDLDKRDHSRTRSNTTLASRGARRKTSKVSLSPSFSRSCHSSSSGISASKNSEIVEESYLEEIIAWETKVTISIQVVQSSFQMFSFGFYSYILDWNFETFYFSRVIMNSMIRICKRPGGKKACTSQLLMMTMKKISREAWM